MSMDSIYMSIGEKYIAVFSNNKKEALDARPL